MRAKLIKDIPTFEQLYDLAPQELKDLIDQCKITQQSKVWHPEGNCYNHIKIVYNRARNIEDLNLAIAGFMHDLGKVETTKPHATKPGAWPAHGHEFVSAKLVKKYADWIKELGADPELVHDVVKGHMRIQQIDNMRPFKKEAFKQEKWFNKIAEFTKLDDMSNLTKDELNIT